MIFETVLKLPKKEAKRFSKKQYDKYCKDFYEKNKYLTRRVSYCYMIIFEDNMFYIGYTNNIASRMYYHTHNCETGTTNIKKKHHKMRESIKNKETIKLYILSNNKAEETEAYFIKKNIMNIYNLNNKPCR